MNNKTFNLVVSLCLIIVTILFGILVINVLNLAPEILASGKAFLKIGLSGIIGVLISVFFVYKQIKEKTLATKISNQIELRKMFSEEKRMEMCRCIKEVSKGKQRKDTFYGENCIFKTESDFKVHRDDYLGLFEIALFMLEHNQVDEDMFFQSYSYKIDCINKCDFVREEIYGCNKNLWGYLKNLIDLNDNWKKTH